MDSLPDQSRIHKVILRHTQYTQEHQDQQTRKQSPVEHREDCCQDSDNKRAGKGNEFKHTREESHYQGSGKSKDREANGGNDPDNQTGGELGAHVRRQCAVYILKELVATPTPTAARKHL